MLFCLIYVPLLSFYKFLWSTSIFYNGGNLNHHCLYLVGFLFTYCLLISCCNLLCQSLFSLSNPSFSSFIDDLLGLRHYTLNLLIHHIAWYVEVNQLSHPHYTFIGFASIQVFFLPFYLLVWLVYWINDVYISRHQYVW